ncbi:lymphocyte antigen 6B-like [Ursus americanus]|uniref:lymphocyte antigen 6B-like n=1 Tax=Ursus arctos TaxID=9644 RepID=UPI000E6DE77D|nr:lymphocyte antigen 6B-like [Ursus arctos]XP_045633216.1 lymphocyte antigen 6B-like [Ursus americanus]
MKAAVVLLVLLCQGGAWALRCHNCTNIAGSTCSGPVDCPSSAQACLSGMLSVELSQEKYAIAAKSCVESCESLVPIQARASVKDVYVYAHCCTSDLCNGAGTQGPGATAMGLMLGASVLVTLSGASL